MTMSVSWCKAPIKKTCVFLSLVVCLVLLGMSPFTYFFLAGFFHDPESRSLWYQKSLQCNADYGPALQGLGFACLELNRYPKAALCFESIVRETPHLAVGWYGLGIVRLAEKDPKAALKHFKRALEIQPEYWQVWQARGKAYSQRGQTSKAFVCTVQTALLQNNAYRALQLCNEAISKKPGKAHGYEIRGNVKKRLSDWRGALSDYDKVLELLPRYARIHFKRGEVLSKMEQEDEAVAAYNLALEHQPDMADALRARGMISLDHGALEDARYDLSHAAKEYVRLNRIKSVMECLEGLRAAEASPALITEIEACRDSLL